MKILFIGNSHTYFNDMPATFAGLWEEAFGEKVDVTMLAYSARSLAWHDNEYFALRFNLLYGNYAYCVIQQQAHPFPGEEETANALRMILDFCKTAGTRPLVVETWPEKAIPENRQPMQEAYRNLAGNYPVKVVPVGTIWAAIQDNHPEIELYWKDGEHASPAGDYLIAVTLCAFISEKSALIFSGKAHDFIRDGAIDFFNSPKVLETVSETETQLSEHDASVIRNTAEEILF